MGPHCAVNPWRVDAACRLALMIRGIRAALWGARVACGWSIQGSPGSGAESRARGRQEFRFQAGAAGSALDESWHCLGGHCPGNLLVQLVYFTTTTLVLRRHCAGTALALHWYSAGLRWYVAGTVLVPYLYHTCTLRVISSCVWRHVANRAHSAARHGGRDLTQVNFQRTLRAVIRSVAVLPVLGAGWLPPEPCTLSVVPLVVSAVVRTVVPAEPVGRRLRNIAFQQRNCTCTVLVPSCYRIVTVLRAL